MEHDYETDGLCDDDRLLAEPPATPTPSSPSLSLPWRARERVVDPTPIQLPITDIQDRSGKSSPPTQPQKWALWTLAKFSPSKVTAWVEILRSLTPGYRHNGSLAPLNPSELSAVHELKDCEEDWLLAWLNVAAQHVVKQPSSIPQISHLQSIASPRGYSRALQPALSTPTLTSSSSLHPSSAFSLRTVQSTVPSTLSNATSYSQPLAIDQRSPTSSKTGAHLHWCHICEHPKSIDTCDGYKRHMREHETIYHCIPNSPVKSTGVGTECYFCGASNPDQTHLDTHDVSKCYGQYANRQSYTRRVNLSKHIKDFHKTSEDRASTLAKAWGDRHKNKRKFFSCGFCICHFPTLKEQISHLDGKHWSQHQELKEWDDNKVILGLLLQPGVKEAWHQLLILANIDSAFHSEFNPAPQWLPSVVKQVQPQLEVGDAPAAALAEFALQKSSFHPIYQAMISNGTLQRSNWNMEVLGHPSTEQHTISTTQLPNEDSPQISLDLPIVDNRLRASHRDRANSYHENAPGSAQILPEVEHGQFQSNIGSYEAASMTSQQDIEIHDHSNPVDLDLLWGTTGSVIDCETFSSSPWSPYTVPQRPCLAQDTVFSEEPNGSQASFDPSIGGMRMDVTSDSAADQPVTYSSHHDSKITEGLSSLVDEATPLISNRVPARRKSRRPIVIRGSKRKLSSSPARESRWEREVNPLVVETGRGSRVTTVMIDKDTWM